MKTIDRINELKSKIEAELSEKQHFLWKLKCCDKHIASYQSDLREEEQRLALETFYEEGKNLEWKGKEEFVQYLDCPVLDNRDNKVYSGQAHWGCGCSPKDFKREIRAGIIALCRKYGYTVVLLKPDYCGFITPVNGVIEYAVQSFSSKWYRDAGLENPEIL